MPGFCLLFIRLFARIEPIRNDTTARKMFAALFLQKKSEYPYGYSDWSEWRDSNPRHPHPKCGALPTALHPDIPFFCFLPPRVARFRLPCVALRRPWRGLASLAWLPSTSASLFPPLAALGCVHQLRYTPIFLSSVFYCRAWRASGCHVSRCGGLGAAAVRAGHTKPCAYCLL